MLIQMRQLLEEHGKLDWKNRMNNYLFFEDGAYSSFEHLLLALSTMTDAQPRGESTPAPR